MGSTFLKVISCCSRTSSIVLLTMTLFDRGDYLWKYLVCSRPFFSHTCLYFFLRAMSRDETRYPNAEQFTPERFLDAEGMLTDDTPDFVFGFGRRICPGKPRYEYATQTRRSYATVLTVVFIIVRSIQCERIPLECHDDDARRARFQSCQRCGRQGHHV